VQKPNAGVLNPDRQFSVKLSVSFALAISDGKVGNPEHPIFRWIPYCRVKTSYNTVHGAHQPRLSKELVPGARILPLSVCMSKSEEKRAMLCSNNALRPKLWSTENIAKQSLIAT